MNNSRGGVDMAPAVPLCDELQRVAARSHAQITAENFPVALRLLPRGPRDGLTRVYGFARFVDDVGDESAGDRLASLDRVATELAARWAGSSVWLRPVENLAPLVGRVELQPFLDLVEANRRDQHVSRYATFADLIDYCSLSAAPVGRIVLQLAGVDDADHVARSDAVCNALQVFEHCQDVAEDARAGRVYLPAEDLAGVAAADLVAPAASPALRAAVALQVQRAEALLAAGPPLVRGLHGWARVAVAGYVAGGQATAAALRAADYDVLAGPVRPSKAATARYALRLLAARR